MKYLLDCDGVLCDFVTGSIKAHNISGYTHDDVKHWSFFEDWGMSATEFFDGVKGYDFWFNLEPYPWAHKFVETLGLDNFVITTSPTMDPECVQAKLDWLYKHFNILMTNVMVGSRKELMAKSGMTLIDDSLSNVAKFKLHGGNALLFPQPWNGGEGNWETILEMLK